MKPYIYNILKSLIKQARPPSHYDMTEEQLEEDTKKWYDFYTNDETKLIITHCIYNDEDHIEEVLKDDIMMLEADQIHILDGAWKNGGTNINSTDRTEEIIKEFAKTSPIPIKFVKNESGKLFESESEKRNFQFDLIQKEFPKGWLFVKDGDEIIHSNSGRSYLWIKKVLDVAYPNVGLLRAYASESNRYGMSPRFIPIGLYHYFTEKSMCIHDKNHNLILDYGEHAKKPSEQTFYIDDMFIVNKYLSRNIERLKEKHEFDVFRDTQEDNVGGCTYESI